MKVKLKFIVISIFLLKFCSVIGQDIELYNQFNGRYDFRFIGNTMNVQENGSANSCMALTSSSAELNLNPGETVESAYLYWAGSGTGDFDVLLNNTPVFTERNFTAIQSSTGNPFFSAFSNITSLVQTTGSSTYTLSEFDISSFLNPLTYCNNGTNFAGWAIVLVIKNDNLPINQINVYDGLKALSTPFNGTTFNLTITLPTLNVIDNIGAKIGFVAWEGDRNIANQESLKINNYTLSNLPLNPANNAFNGTNTFTGSNTLFNMDLDVYDIQNNIQVGDTSAQIQLSTAQDFVLINTIVTKLNSQLPDATISLNQIQKQCNSRIITVDYTVSNLNSTDILPSGTPIAIYANGVFIQYDETILPIQIGDSYNSQITLTIPDSIPNNFTLQFVVDDLGNGVGIVSEIIEINNSFSIPVSLLVLPEFNNLPDVFYCVNEIATTTIDFSNYSNLVLVNNTDTIRFFLTINDAINNINSIENSSNFNVNKSITTIYIRLDNDNCFSITSFNINLILFPNFTIPDDILICKENEFSSFNFSNYTNTIKMNKSDIVTFFETDTNANDNTNSIKNSDNYLPNSTPKTIFIRIDNGHCYSTTSFIIDYYDLPTFNKLQNLVSCNEGLTRGTFNFSNYEQEVKTNDLDNVSFFSSLEDATNSTNEIIDTFNYVATSTPSEIFVRIENENCFNYTSFLLTTKICPPIVYNYISANDDDYNNSFHIDGLRDIFLNHQIYIYNRWGRLVWTGNNNTPEWEGFSNKGFLFDSTNSPKGTYYYIIYLNEDNYPEPLQGYLYLTR